jgi:hypothetical protein
MSRDRRNGAHVDDWICRNWFDWHYNFPRPSLSKDDDDSQRHHESFSNLIDAKLLCCISNKMTNNGSQAERPCSGSIMICSCSTMMRILEMFTEPRFLR